MDAEVCSVLMVFSWKNKAIKMININCMKAKEVKKLCAIIIKCLAYIRIKLCGLLDIKPSALIHVLMISKHHGRCRGEHNDIGKYLR